MICMHLKNYHNYCIYAGKILNALAQIVHCSLSSIIAHILTYQSIHRLLYYSIMAVLLLYIHRLVFLAY